MAKLDHGMAEGLKGPAPLAGRALFASQTKGGPGTREIGPERGGHARSLVIAERLGGSRTARPTPNRGRLGPRSRPACLHEGFHSGTTRYDRGARLLRFVLVCEDCGTEMREVRRVAYSPQYERTQARSLAA